MSVSPSMTVEDFIIHLEKHPENNQTHFGQNYEKRKYDETTYLPFDPSIVGRYDGLSFTPDDPEARTSCSFQFPKSTSARRKMTIKEAGLVNNAQLMQRETLMCD